MDLPHVLACWFPKRKSHRPLNSLREQPDLTPQPLPIRPAIQTAKTVVDPASRPLESPEKALRGEEILLRVEVLTGPMDGLTHFSVRKEIILGRTTEADLILELDSRVSGRHARLYLEQGLIWLEDLGSTNGTFIGKEPLCGKIPVAPGVQFTVGRTLIEVLPERGGA